jgi:hypothetical protein
MDDHLNLHAPNYVHKRSLLENEHFKLKDQQYNPMIHIKKQDNIQYKSNDYIPAVHKPRNDSQIDFCDKEIQRKYKFELDMFKLSDYEFVNWANQQSDFLVMAIMAEMKQSPKMRDEIERLRPEIYKIPLMPIYEYKIIRKLGDRYASFLRKLKQEYGNNLLRLLYITST